LIQKSSSHRQVLISVRSCSSITCPFGIPTPTPYPSSFPSHLPDISSSFRSVQERSLQSKKKKTAQISSKSTVSLPPLTDPPHDPGERHLRDVLHAFSQYNTITSLSPGNSNLLNFPSKAFFGSLNQPNPSQDLGRGRRRRLTQRRRHLSRLVLRNRRLLLVLLLVGRDHVHCRAAVPRLVVLFDRGFKERGEGRVSNCSKPKRGFVLLIESKKKQLSYLSCSWDRTGAWEAGSACCGA
jgi:hypothetical protein